MYFFPGKYENASLIKYFYIPSLVLWRTCCGKISNDWSRLFCEVTNWMFICFHVFINISFYWEFVEYFMKLFGMMRKPVIKKDPVKKPEPKVLAQVQKFRFLFFFFSKPYFNLFWTLEHSNPNLNFKIFTICSGFPLLEKTVLFLLEFRQISILIKLFQKHPFLS